LEKYFKNGRFGPAKRQVSMWVYGNLDCDYSLDFLKTFGLAKPTLN